MPAATLSNLIRLLDDDSDLVRRAVRAQLEHLRPELHQQLDLLDRPLTLAEDRIMAEMLAPSRREELEDQWMLWRQQPDENTQIEMALGQLSAFLSGWRARPRMLTERLNQIAIEVLEAYPKLPTAHELADWLFGGRSETARLRGNSKTYYAPDNSNLLAVLDSGVGNPISLCTLYRLIGARVGLVIDGCNFPGHFLARVPSEGTLWLVDCFNRGRFMHADDVARHHPAANPGMEELVHQRASVDSVLLRFLRNLDDAFARANEMAHRQLVRRLVIKLMGDSVPF
jgi:regulator of sirC expression with transglutaminase-like and TPR domain